MNSEGERQPAPSGLAEAVSREEAPLDLIRSFFAALQERRLRGASDTRATERLKTLGDAVEAVARRDGAVRIHRTGPHLLINRIRIHPDPDVRLAVRALWSDLEGLGIGGFEMDAGLDPSALGRFLDQYPTLRGELEQRGEFDQDDDQRGRRRLRIPVEIVPGILALPHRTEPAGEIVQDEDRRARARRVFFRALAGARAVVRQLSVQRITELRKARAVVHEMVDCILEEEFSLIGLTAIQDFDPYTFQHSVHVSVLSMALGQGLGLSRQDLADLGVAALFHDMGKVHVPKQVLQKPGRFDRNDWAAMRLHPLAGARELVRLGGGSDLAARIMLVSVEHHMRFDGSGYPRLGEDWQQGLYSRLVALADCYDAMTASRAYMKRPFTPDAVVRYMIENTGRMFDPDLLRLFVGKMGLFPVGSLIRLESGELGLVLEPPSSAREVERPLVRVLRSTPGGWRPVEDRRLSGGSSADPRRRIQAGCHPLDHGVDVDGLLSDFYLGDAG